MRTVDFQAKRQLLRAELEQAQANHSRVALEEAAGDGSPEQTAIARETVADLLAQLKDCDAAEQLQRERQAAADAEETRRERAADRRAVGKAAKERSAAAAEADEHLTHLLTALERIRAANVRIRELYANWERDWERIHHVGANLNEKNVTSFIEGALVRIGLPEAAHERVSAARAFHGTTLKKLIDAQNERAVSYMAPCFNGAR